MSVEHFLLRTSSTFGSVFAEAMRNLVNPHRTSATNPALHAQDFLLALVGAKAGIQVELVAVVL